VIDVRYSGLLGDVEQEVIGHVARALDSLVGVEVFDELLKPVLLLRREGCLGGGHGVGA